MRADPDGDKMRAVLLVCGGAQARESRAGSDNLSRGRGVARFILVFHTPLDTQRYKLSCCNKPLFCYPQESKEKNSCNKLLPV